MSYKDRNKTIIKDIYKEALKYGIGIPIQVKIDTDYSIGYSSTHTARKSTFILRQGEIDE